MKTKLISFLNENVTKQVKLIDIFGSYPDDDELIWEFISPFEFKKDTFEIQSIPITDVVTTEFLDNFKENAKPWQKKLVKNCMIDPDLKNQIIIVTYINNEYIVIDGNHKLMTMYKKGFETVNVVNLSL